MTSRIVVPLDGSEFSETALPVADAIAGSLGANIHLLAAGWGTTVEELQRYLDAKATTLHCPTSTCIAPDTFPASAITEVLETSEDFVVMSTHGRSGIGKALLGSVAEDVLQRTDRAVVLLGPHASGFTSFDGGLLAITTDGSPTSAVILPKAASWAKALGMSVRVLTVTAAGGTPLGKDAPEDSSRAAEAAVAFLTEMGVTAEAVAIIGANAAHATVEWANANNIALLAMATHGRGGIARTAMGSTAMKVVHDAHCAVLVQKASL